MQIRLSKQSPDKGGDIIALGRLLHILELCWDSHYPKERGRQITLELWLEYLKSIENHLLAANMGRVTEKSVFNLPFERDFVKKWKELRNEHNSN